MNTFRSVIKDHEGDQQALFMNDDLVETKFYVAEVIEIIRESRKNNEDTIEYEIALHVLMRDEF